MKSFFEYCRDYVRREDLDRYAITMFAPQSKRPALFALFAFNAEIAKTREVVSETTTGLMRLLWWREAIQAIYQDKHEKDHPVLNALAQIIKDYNLPLKLFEDMTYGREFDLEDTQPGNVEGLKNYCLFSHKPLLELCLIVNPDRKLDVDALAVQHTTAGLLCSFVPHSQQARIYIPKDLMRGQGLNKDKLLSMRYKKEVKAISKQIRQKLDLSNQNILAETAFFKAYAALSHMYIKRIEKLGDDLLDYRMTYPPLFRGLRLWKATIF